MVELTCECPIKPFITFPLTDQSHIADLRDNMVLIALLLSVVFVLGGAATNDFERGILESRKCKCGPDDACWPSHSAWESFNRTVNGRLIKTAPIAQSCYPGPNLNLAECASVDQMWTNESFQTTRPLGLPYPWNITCYPLNYTAGDRPTAFPLCILGNNPRYAVNATSAKHIYDTIAFAKRQNIRLVTKGTGHDLLGRSDGYGSLELWLRYHRNSIKFQARYEAARHCTKSGWTGSAMLIDGTYQWEDVIPVAQENNVIVVTGGSPSVGATGGWQSGGGHGPATRNYGLGADQLLEARVLLQNGRIVTANACENSDLYRAMRGGGPGYGITLSTVVKTYPNVRNIGVQHLAIAPRNENVSAMLDAAAVMFQSYPDLNDAGYAGYGFWFLNSPAPIVNDSFAGYTHGFWAIGKTAAETRAAFDPVRQRLEALGDSITFSETYVSYNDYWTFYNTESGLHQAVGMTPTLTSRLIDRPAVADYAKVRAAMEKFAGPPEEFTSNTILLVSGGQVSKDGSDPFSGLNPAWRRSPFASIVGRGWPFGANNTVQQSIRDDITFVKGAAQRELAPDTGAYMNEGNREDPDYIRNFYGTNYREHLATKRKYDPHDLCYCPTCVGSERWVERPDAPLCRI